MMKLWQKLLKMRELTKNEKFLLSILGVILLAWGSYQLVILPQFQKLASFNVQKLEYQEKIDEMQSILSKEDHINTDLKRLSEEKEEIASRYFPTLDQAQIIYLLNSLLVADELEIVDMNFSRPSDEEIGELQVKSMDISIPYNGTYDGIINTIKSLKSSPRKIMLDSISMDRDKEGSLHGNISLKIYGLDGMVSTDNRVIDLHTEKRGQTSTPFTAYNDYREESDGDSQGADSLEGRNDQGDLLYLGNGELIFTTPQAIWK